MANELICKRCGLEPREPRKQLCDACAEKSGFRGKRQLAFSVRREASELAELRARVAISTELRWRAAVMTHPHTVFAMRKSCGG